MDDSAAITAALQMAATVKVWAGPTAVPWRDAAGKPKGYSFRTALTIGDIQPAGLFIVGYFKADGIGTIRDKLSLSLIHNGARLVGLDDGGLAAHRNSTGIGRPFYGKRVGVPHLHTISNDAIEGYAEPVGIAPPEDLWTLFLRHATIADAPPLGLPVIQRSLI